MNLISPDHLFYMAAVEAAAVNKLVAQLVLVVVELVELPAAQMMVVKVIMQYFGEEEVAEQDVSQLYRDQQHSQVDWDIMEFVFFAILINLNLIYHPLLQHRQIKDKVRRAAVEFAHVAISAARANLGGHVALCRDGCE